MFSILVGLKINQRQTITTHHVVTFLESENSILVNYFLVDVNLEEKVCSLTYQLNEVTADLKLTQRQLAACVEQNKRLIADLLSLKHKPQYRQV